MAEGLEAENVLRSMVARYASFDSYSDRGEVTVQHFEGQFETQTPFSTLYQRMPLLFRFECVRSHPHPPLKHIKARHVTGFDGTNAFTIKRKHKGEPEFESIQQMSLAIAGACVYSNGAVATIGNLFFPDPKIGALPATDLVNAEVHQDIAIDGDACYVISSVNPRLGIKVELAIEKERLILRRRVLESETVRFEECRVNIRVNESIERSLFAAELNELP